jgi:hypothetical protein
MANYILTSEYNKELWLKIFRLLAMGKIRTTKEYEKDRMILEAFRKEVAKNKASANPIPDGEIPPEMARLVASTPNAHIETLGNLHTIVINDNYD